MNGICRVCELLDKDIAIKRTYFCKSCNANICYQCRPEMLRRAKAMLMEMKLKLKK
jgi:hypothetical protein